MQPAPAGRTRSRWQRLLLVLIVVAAVLLVLGVLGSRLLAGSPDFHATEYAPPVAAADFTLTAHTGDRTSLADFRGTPVLLFFGYTHCPDVCPTTLASLRDALEAADAGPEDARILLITVDPERDDPAVLASYVSNFGPAVVGLTGEAGEIRRLMGAYGVYAEAEHANPAMLGHTSAVFGIDAEGAIRVLLRPGAPREELRADVATLLRL